MIHGRWSPQGEAQGRKNQRALMFVGFGVAVPSLPMKKTAKPNLVITVVLLVALRL